MSFLVSVNLDFIFGFIEFNIKLNILGMAKLALFNYLFFTFHIII